MRATPPPGFRWDLIPGDNLIKVKVTGRTGGTNIYTLTVRRAAGTALEPNPPLPAGATVIYTGDAGRGRCQTTWGPPSGAPHRPGRRSLSEGTVGSRRWSTSPVSATSHWRTRQTAPTRASTSITTRNRLVLQVGGRQYRIADATYVHPHPSLGRRRPALVGRRASRHPARGSSYPRRRGSRPARCAARPAISR